MINNAFYEELQDNWYDAHDHPIALLRAENAVRTPWIISEMAKRHAPGASLLDIGCGGGLLTNAVQKAGFKATGIDLSESSLKVAKRFDATGQVHYLVANAYDLPFPDQTFDAIAAMDVLEHVENPNRLIEEASRVLKPGGTFFFHTFNRNLLSYVLIIKGVEWCVKNTPKNMHVYPFFIKPQELKTLCSHHKLKTELFVGLRPTFLSLSFFKMLFTRKVPPRFSFQFCKSLATGYCGIAQKEPFAV